MTEPIFECANIPVSVCASVLHVDAQTVRLLLQSGAVDWGIAYKRGNGKTYSYIIYAKKFYEATGFAYHKVETEVIDPEDMLRRCEELLNDCVEALKHMQPAFLHDTEEVERISNKCEELLAKVDMLKDYVKGGGVDE